MLLLTETTYQALTVLLVGMTTVFFILFLVVLSGRLLIGFLNRTGFVFNKKTISPSPTKSSVRLEELEVALIEGAIQKWSKGQATIKDITKL